MESNLRNVLIVDDDNGMRFTLQGIIEDEGYEVSAAIDGYQAIELAKETPFRLVFLDVSMPGLNGVETFLELKKIIPDARVVIMTGFSVEELVERARDEGIYTVLYKPMRAERVVEIVHSAFPENDMYNQWTQLRGTPGN